MRTRQGAEVKPRHYAERYSVLFEHDLAAVLYSADDKLLDCNDATCQMLG
jgi:hypothetical protein